MATNYEKFKLCPQYIANVPVPNKLTPVTTNNETLVDDDGNLYEILVVTDEYSTKVDDDHETEEYELLEVTNVDSAIENYVKQTHDIDETLQSAAIEVSANTNTVKSENQSPNAQNEHEHIIENDDNSKKCITRRSARITKAKENAEKKNSNKVKSVCSNGNARNRNPSKKKRSIENALKLDDVQLNSDIAEGDSDDEFPARDSDNEDWPSQETLDEFPREIIKNGLLLIKGKELMSLICRFYNLDCKTCEKKQRFK